MEKQTVTKHNTLQMSLGHRANKRHFISDNGTLFFKSKQANTNRVTPVDRNHLNLLQSLKDSTLNSRPFHLDKWSLTH